MGSPTITQEEFAAKLPAHAEWWDDYNAGKASWSDTRRLDLRDYDLRHIDFHGARLDGASLVDASLDIASLVRASLVGARLDGARLDGARLDGARLDGASLVDARLDGARLEKIASFPVEMPIVENIDQKILDAILDDSGDLRTVSENGAGESVPALEMSSWHHSCGTSHCRAGWAITLAGGEGRMLEKLWGPEVAGTMIYLASRPGKAHPNFYAANGEALASLKADAAEAAAV